jgi:hypothetical protein
MIEVGRVVAKLRGRRAKGGRGALRTPTGVLLWALLLLNGCGSASPGGPASERATAPVEPASAQTASVQARPVAPSATSTTRGSPHRAPAGVRRRSRVRSAGDSIQKPGVKAASPPVAPPSASANDPVDTRTRSRHTTPPPPTAAMSDPIAR